MPDMLSTGADWLASTLKTSASQSVTYRRKSIESDPISATRGNTEAETADSGGSLVIVRIDDFLVDPADLVLGGVTITPESGDEIDAADGTFRVLPINGGPCSRKSGSRVRIHTKRIRD